MRYCMQSPVPDTLASAQKTIWFYHYCIINNLKCREVSFLRLSTKLMKYKDITSYALPGQFSAWSPQRRPSFSGLPVEFPSARTQWRITRPSSSKQKQNKHETLKTCSRQKILSKSRPFMKITSLWLPYPSYSLAASKGYPGQHVSFFKLKTQDRIFKPVSLTGFPWWLRH